MPRRPKHDLVRYFRRTVGRNNILFLAGRIIESEIIGLWGRVSFKAIYRQNPYFDGLDTSPKTMNPLSYKFPMAITKIPISTAQRTAGFPLTFDAPLDVLAVVVVAAAAAVLDEPVWAGVASADAPVRVADVAAGPEAAAVAPVSAE
jgi:hypothetical protein